EPAPPLKTAHWLRSIFISAKTIGTFFIIWLLQQERWFNRAIFIRTAAREGHLPARGIHAVEGHAAPEGRLIGGDHLRTPFRAEERRLARYALQSREQPAL